MDMENRSVAAVIVDQLCAHGINKVFSVPGVNILPILEEIENRKGIKNIVCKTEIGAAYMADGYARINGMGCCIATTGPGITNTITGVAASYYDSVPVLYLSAQVSKDEIGKYGIQEMSGEGRTPNVLNMMKNITKYANTINDKDLVKLECEEAFRIMNNGRKGPCYLEMCENILNLVCDSNSIDINEKNEINSLKTINVDYSEVMELIKESKRTVLLVGNGAREVERLSIQKLVEKLDISCVATLLAKDKISIDAEHYFGVIGCYGNFQANDILMNADTIIILGATLNYLSTSGWSMGIESKKIIRIDIDKNELKRNVTPTKAYCCDAAIWLEGFIQYLNHKQYKIIHKKQKAIECEELDCMEAKDLFCDPIKVIDIVNNYKSKNDVIVSDVGQNAYWTERYITIENSTKYIANGGMGAMGYGVASSVGVSAAVGELNEPANTICFCGDGGFLMTGTEISTCSENHLKVIWIIFNNNGLGTQNAWARNVDYNIRFNINNVSYVEFARSLGVEGIKVCNDDEFEKVFIQAQKMEKPILIEVAVDYMKSPKSYYGDYVNHINR